MRQYETEEEEEKRKVIFMGNLKFIREHNQKFESQEESFAVAVNQFADMVSNELLLQHVLG